MCKLAFSGTEPAANEGGKRSINGFGLEFEIGRAQVHRAVRHKSEENRVAFGCAEVGEDFLGQNEPNGMAVLSESSFKDHKRGMSARMSYGKRPNRATCC